MKTTFLLVGIILCSHVIGHAYLPQDPSFIKAEPFNPYVAGEPNEAFDEEAWIFDEMFPFFSFAPYYSEKSAIYRDAARFGTPQVSGSSIDLAWDFSRGDSSTVLAIIDTGVVWDDREVVERLFLNKGELPPPDNTRPDIWDVNNDGVFNVMDYYDSGEFDDRNGNQIIDPQDLILKFSDQVDDDNNGFTDDICGWDFFEDDNDPEDTSSYSAAKFHGRGQMHGAAGQQNKAMQQEAPEGGCGVCPECMILPLKDWDSFAVNTDYFGAATLYAAKMGADVISGAIGGMNSSGICQYAFKYAYDMGIPLFMVSSDLNSANHNFPTYLNEPIYCSGIVPDTYPIPGIRPTTYFRDSNLTQYGAKNHISFEVVTGSQATAMASGAGGLILSYAKSNQIALHPDQVKQLLTMTAEDVLPENTGFIGRPDPAQEGWDQHFGYGRVNLAAVMEKIKQGNIPPVARITSPAWFSYLDPRRDVLIISGDILPPMGKNVSWVLEAGYGIEPEQFSTLESGAFYGENVQIAEIELDRIKAIFPQDVDLSSYPSEPEPLDPGDANIQANRHLFTIRLKVVSDPFSFESADELLPAEDRRTFFLHEDNSFHVGWPKYIGVGGEGALRFVDLDGDNLKEVVVPTSDGRILVFTHDGRPYTVNGKPMNFHSEPFEITMNHGLNAPAHDFRPGFTSIAIGDIDRDGIKEIIGAAGSRVYCFKATGGKAAGFPIDFSENFIRDTGGYDPRDKTLNFDNHIGPGAFAAPVLHDMDNDGDLEIILGACDQRVYAWHHDGSAVHGWPVYTALAPGIKGARIIHAPCLADLEGDGSMEIIVATNEVVEKQRGALDTEFGPWGSVSNSVPAIIKPFVLSFLNALAGKDCLVYAIHADGNENSAGAIVAGWPVRVRALLPDLLPFLGPSSKPCAYDFNNDGTDEVVAGFTSSKTSLINGKGNIVKQMDQVPVGARAVGLRERSPVVINTFDSAALGDITGDGEPEIANGGLTLKGALNLVLSGQNLTFNHVIQAWDPLSGAYLDSFPRITDDYLLFAEPAIADVSGDGIPEIISGSGLYLVHAFGADGMDKQGFPKLAAGWIMASPAVADIDNDDQNELGVVTREGWIFLWDTPGEPGDPLAWPTYGHDNFNTSNLSFDAAPPASVTEITWTGQGVRFVCPGDDGYTGRAEKLNIYGSEEPIYAGVLQNADLLKALRPVIGGDIMEVMLEKAYAYYSVVAVDEAGNQSQVPLSKETALKPEHESPPALTQDTPAGWSGGESNGACFISGCKTHF